MAEKKVENFGVEAMALLDRCTISLTEKKLKKILRLIKKAEKAH